MLNENDKVIEARLYTPHVTDFICEREDGTHYVYMPYRDSDSRYYDLQPNPSKETRWIMGNKINTSVV